MSQVDYAKMSDNELRKYFLKSRPRDQAAFHAYMDRLNSRPRQVTIHPDDPDFDQKLQEAILKQMSAAEHSNEAN